MSNLTANPIFIFASGQRCGSTLLQRLLCSHSQIMIWGEHDGTLGKMFKNFDRLLEWEGMFRHQYHTFVMDGVNNFIPNMNPSREVIRKAQIEMVKNLWQVPAEAMGRSIWGFKEVLYDAQMALYLRDLFPDARVIHLTRNIFDCFISLRHEEGIAPEDQPHVPSSQTWTRARTKEFIACWIDINRSFLETPGLDDSWFFSMTYDQLTLQTDETVRLLVDWLGMDLADFNMEVFRHKLYTDRHKGEDPRPRIERADLSDDEVALVTTEEILALSRHFNFDMSVPQRNI